MADEQAVTPEDVRAFEQVAREFVKDHADLPELLGKMEPAGFEMSTAATSEIIRLRRPDITAWLASLEGRADAHALKNLAKKPAASIEFIRKLADRLTRHGFAQRYEPKLRDEDKYLEQRRADIRSGKRRR